MKAAIKREQSDACIGFAKREQARREASCLKKLLQNLANSKICTIFASKREVCQR